MVLPIFEDVWEIATAEVFSVGSILLTNVGLTDYKFLVVLA